MSKRKEKNIIMQGPPKKRLQALDIVISVLTFAALYLTFASVLPTRVTRYVCVLIGVTFAALFLVFSKNKIAVLSILGVAGLYTLLCGLVDPGAFRDGAVLLWNGIAESVNINVGAGWKSANVSYYVAADYLISSVISLWLALGIAALSRKSKLSVVAILGVVMFVLLCVGLYPKAYAASFLLLMGIAQFTLDRKYNLRAAVCYIISAEVALLAMLPLFLYDGSSAVKNFRDGISSGAQSMIYGTDSLPEGKLNGSFGMKSDGTTRLKVTLAEQTDTLYLKGFVGGKFDGKQWAPTDKNTYVQNGYQGLIEYVAKRGIPFTQYAEYSKLCGVTTRYDIKVTDVAANSKYVYTPYTIIDYSTGTPYYDMNIRGGGGSYDFTVFSGYTRSERVKQADWVYEEGTALTKEYLELEREYRAFVYDTYTGMTDKQAALIEQTFVDSDAKTISTITQLIRAFFTEKYVYTDNPTAVKSDFVSEFFGGELTTANCAYFATAAAYIFRSFGYPSRYAEGYLVRSDVDETGETVTVTGKDAHAWCEVYFDGVGWLPIEVTPTYFVEMPPETMVDPVNPDQPEDPPPPVEPELPSDPPPEIETPPSPITSDGKKPQAPQSYEWMIALIAIASVLLGVLLVILAFTLYRRIVMRKKRRLLSGKGESYGKAAYGIVERDLAFYGGFNAGMLEERGVPKTDTDRFIQLVEKSVYGGYDLSVNERSYVTHYINAVADTLDEGGKLKQIINRYVLCLGIEEN